MADKEKQVSAEKRLEEMTKEQKKSQEAAAKQEQEAKK
jgi:hypothetical protein